MSSRAVVPMPDEGKVILLRGQSLVVLSTGEDPNKTCMFEATFRSPRLASQTSAISKMHKILAGADQRLANRWS